MKLRLSHFEQLEMYIDSYSDSGFYYGNKEQFTKRHNDLKKWVESLIENELNKKNK